MTKRIAIFGSSFNSLGIHHWNCVADIVYANLSSKASLLFDEVIVRPCGPRPDKETTNDTLPIHRAAMTDMTFGGFNHCTVDLNDLEKSTFTTAYDVLAQYSQEEGTEAWLVVEGCYIKNGHVQASDIHSWYRGAELWEQTKFIVLVSHDFDRRDLPPKSIVIEVEGLTKNNSSPDIRSMVFSGHSIDGLVTSRVKNYIERHRLYRGAVSRNPVSASLDLQRPLVILDKGPGYVNEKAVQIANQLGFPTDNVDDPSCIIVLGGDGFMMQTVRRYRHLRVPFFGINAGHLGFHLNELGERTPSALVQSPMDSYYMPMLLVEYRDPMGAWHSTLAYQDAWMQDFGKALWVKTIENGVTQYDPLVCDTVLVALPIGSTAYAQAMGASTLPINATQLTFAVSCFNRSSQPKTYIPRSPSFDTLIEIHNLQPER